VADPFKGGNERRISQNANSMRLRHWFSWKDFLCALFIVWVNSSGLDLLQFVVMSISTAWITEYFLISMKYMYMSLDEPSVTWFKLWVHHRGN